MFGALVGFHIFGIILMIYSLFIMFRGESTYAQKLVIYFIVAEIVQNAEVFSEHFVISECNSENLESPTVVAAQAANELLNINGVKASFVLTMFNNTVYISARSIDEVNVQIIMEQLGGGGHMSIAGAQLTGVTVEEGKKLLKEIVKRMLEEGDI